MLSNTSGFVYYVSIMGITGTKAATEAAVRQAVERLKRHCDLPIAVGFGIRTPEQAAEVVRVADAAVVGTALVDVIAGNLDDEGNAQADVGDKLLGLVGELAQGVRAARK